MANSPSRSLSPHSGDPVALLIHRLKAAGINRGYVERVLLPQGWLRSAHHHDVVARLADGLGVDEETLLDPRADITPGTAENHRLKTRTGNTPQDFQWAVALSTRAAALAAKATGTDSCKYPSSASDLRNEILQRHEYVSFDLLLDWCWQHGITVLHMSNFPAKTRKMDGLATQVDDRAVIVLCKNATHKAWQIFILAHELGHICLGHVAESDDLRIDVDVDRESTESDEKAANDFAVELLTGSAYKQYTPRGRRLFAGELASAAKIQSKRDRVDPGVIVMNYAYGQGFFPIANAALQHLPDQDGAPELVQERFENGIAWDQLTSEDAMLLRNLTRP